CQKYSGSPLTF
nr:immunoglobulin light chain junction region [Macaca mulatta]